jgi:transposase
VGIPKSLDLCINVGNGREIRMGRALTLRQDYASDDLKRLARASRDSNQTRRLLALSVIYDGDSRAAAARIGGVGRQIVRDWVERFNAEGPGGLIDRKAPGNPSKLNDGQRAALAQIVERGPIPAVDDVVRWRLIDLTAWVWDEFRLSLSETTMSRELKALGFAKISARPRHQAQNTEALAAFKKISPPRSRKSGTGLRPASR